MAACERTCEQETTCTYVFKAYLRHMVASRSISVSMCSCSSPGLSSTWQMGQTGAWLSYRDIFFLPGEKTGSKIKGETSVCVNQNVISMYQYVFCLFYLLGSTTSAT